MDSSFHTVTLHAWLGQIRAGNKAATDQLVRRIAERMERLARKMLRQFPNVNRWEQTCDVVQNALLRFLRTLEKIEPASVREFFSLAAVHIRRELLDLARHYDGKQGHGANLASWAGSPGGEESGAAFDPADRRDNAGDLEKWSAFHLAVEELEAEEREVVSLVFYHDMKQADIAELFGVNERTVRRKWQTALLHLAEKLKQDLPNLNG